MKKVKMKHLPTGQISKDMPYTIKCACGNIIVAGDEPIPEHIKVLVRGVPCSECKVESYAF